ncbi:hypothetical protein BDN70DRAFT_886459 [Pholiota conissans]|uniref:DUF6697 domain-containing protein n=1 Tax=Pholiota conissans TaxID=109636 RepID=A0A9P6CMZ4_9AGAR|nr:hypothetical protein BDN70DRAFT_886459 [Pholiota conissans]
MTAEHNPNNSEAMRALQSRVSQLEAQLYAERKEKEKYKRQLEETQDVLKHAQTLLGDAVIKESLSRQKLQSRSEPPQKRQKLNPTIGSAQGPQPEIITIDLTLDEVKDEPMQDVKAETNENQVQPAQIPIAQEVPVTGQIEGDTKHNINEDQAPTLQITSSSETGARTASPVIINNLEMAGIQTRREQPPHSVQTDTLAEVPAETVSSVNEPSIQVTSSTDSIRALPSVIIYTNADTPTTKVGSEQPHISTHEAAPTSEVPQTENQTESLASDHQNVSVSENMTLGVKTEIIEKQAEIVEDYTPATNGVTLSEICEAEGEPAINIVEKSTLPASTASNSVGISLTSNFENLKVSCGSDERHGNSETRFSSALALNIRSRLNQNQDFELISLESRIAERERLPSDSVPDILPTHISASLSVQAQTPLASSSGTQSSIHKRTKFTERASLPRARLYNPHIRTTRVHIPNSKKSMKMDDGPSLSISVVENYLKSSPDLDIIPPPLDLEVSRVFLRVNYGGSDMQFLQHFHADKNPSGNVIRQVVFPQLGLNPYMPSSPGKSGLIFASRHEIVENPPWTVFRRNKEKAVWRYLGEYESVIVGVITPEQFRSQLDSVQHQWASHILGCKKHDVYVAMRARIALRKAGRIPVTCLSTAEENAEEGKELVKTEMARYRSGRGLPLVREEVVEAFRKGDEAIDIIKMQCVKYDHVFANDMRDKSLNEAGASTASKRTTAASGAPPRNVRKTTRLATKRTNNARLPVSLSTPPTTDPPVNDDLDEVEIIDVVSTPNVGVGGGFRKEDWWHDDYESLDDDQYGSGDDYVP